MTKKSPWDIEEKSFPQGGTSNDLMRFFLRYAILAPSAHNTQPWKCIIREGTLEIHKDEKHMLQVGDPTQRQTYIGLGAFLENFIIASSHWGYRAILTEGVFISDDSLICKVTLRRSLDLKNNRLFPGILKRHTNRGRYNPSSIPSSITRRLQNYREKHTRLYCINDHEAKDRISQLVQKGMFIGLSLKPLRKELADYVSLSEQNRDTGLILEAMVEHPVDMREGREWVDKHLEPKTESIEWGVKFRSCPLIIIIATETDGPEAWVEAGRVMERVLLEGAVNGHTHDLCAAPVEIPSLITPLRREIDYQYRPQVLFRLGVPSNNNFTKHSNRRINIISEL